MGIVGDLYEAAWDHYGRRLQERLAQDPDFWQPPPPRCTCPHCAATFSDAESLHRHLFAAHRQTFGYLQVDGLVCGCGVCELLGSIQDIRFFYRHPPGDVLEVRVYEEGAESPAFHTVPLIGAEGWVYLTACVGPEARGVEVRLRGDTAPLATVRARPVQPAPRALEAVEEVVGQLQAAILRGVRVDWGEWRRRVEGAAADPEAAAYGRGFLDYLYAHCKELRGDPDAALYQQAYAVLRTFATPMATTACALIDFKRNTFWPLLRLPAESVFRLPGWFFLAPFAEVNRCRGRHRPLRWPSRRGVLADDCTEKLIWAVHLYGAGQLDKVRRELAALVDHPLVRQGANWTKLCLVMGRLHRSMGDADQARRWYRQIRDDPDFAEEAFEVVGG